MNEKRIRKRQSYAFWLNLLRYFESKHKPKEILRKMFSVLDDRQSFGSMTNASYSKESLELMLKDRGLR